MSTQLSARPPEPPPERCGKYTQKHLVRLTVEQDEALDVACGGFEPAAHIRRLVAAALGAGAGPAVTFGQVKAVAVFAVAVLHPTLTPGEVLALFELHVEGKEGGAA